MKALRKAYLKKQGAGNVKRAVNLKPPHKFKSVLLVTNNSNKSLKKFVEEQFINASVYQLYCRNIKVDDTTGFYHSVHPSDFNLTGKLKNDKLKNLLDMKLDLLLDLSGDSELLEHFVNRSTASLKIGTLSSDKTELYDLMVESQADEEKLVSNIIEQLNRLTQNEPQSV